MLSRAHYQSIRVFRRERNKFMDSSNIWRQQDTNHWWTAAYVDTPTTASTPATTSASAQATPSATSTTTPYTENTDQSGYGHWVINATSDGGQHWTTYPRPQWYQIDRVDFASNTTGFAVAYTGHYDQGQGYQTGLYKTTDGGKTWQLVK